MRDYELEILEHYDIEVRSTHKIRGAFFCDTNEGTMVLKETRVSDKRAPFMYKMLCKLEEEGYPNVDLPVATEEGSFISTSRDGTRYMLKRWFYGRECDVRKQQDVLAAVENLAVLHQKMRWTESEDGEVPMRGRHLREEFLSHNRELKKVRSFMRNKVNKGNFEYLFLKHFEQMFQYAVQALRRLETSDYDLLYQKSIGGGYLVHGDYNYHNVLILGNSGADAMATTNFEHVRLDVQVQDLYYFLRKVMEKHKWDAELGRRILESYHAVRKLEEVEREYLVLKLLYPEKFWKIASAYYHSNKAWIPEKNVEKLRLTIAQSEEKLRFLDAVF